MNTRTSRAALGTSVLALCAVAVIGAGPAQAGGSDDDRHKNSHSRGYENRTVVLNADLEELNGSGASGKARVLLRGDEILRIKVRAKGLTPGVPHAQHIHYGDQALNECPSLAVHDDNDDGRINTVEGVPAYGPVVVSLNTTGDTTPASFLDVTRFPVADEKGRIDYRRSHIGFTDVAGTGYGGDGGTAEQIRQSIRDGEGVLVIHGLDYDGNGTYNFSDPEGASELNPALPAEATDPAVCGVLR